MHYLPALTSLRFFAAASIFFLHLQGPFGLGSPFEPFGLGVSFFFVLSGFILTHVYGRSAGVSVAGFAAHRIARLWPVHLITLGVAFWAFHSGIVYMPGWQSVLLTNLFLVQSWWPVNGYVYSFNAVSWSISTEFAFYLAFPFLLRTRHMVKVWVGLCVLTMAIVGSLDFSDMRLAPIEPWVFSPAHLIQQHPTVRMLEFAAGVFTGRLFLTGTRLTWSETHASIMQGLSVIVVLLFAATAMPIRQMLGEAGLRQIGLWYCFSGGYGAFAFLIYAFAYADGALSRLLTAKTLVRLGEASFALYMVHQLWIRWAIDDHWIERFGRLPALSAVVVLSVVSALLLWRAVEIPARRMLLGRFSLSGTVSRASPTPSRASRPPNPAIRR